MPQFAVFFSEHVGFAMEVVQAMDAAHAQDIARAQHPTGRLSAALVEGPWSLRSAQVPHCLDSNYQ